MVGLNSESETEKTSYGAIDKNRRQLETISKTKIRGQRSCC